MERTKPLFPRINVPETKLATMAVPRDRGYKGKILYLLLFIPRERGREKKETLSESCSHVLDRLTKQARECLCSIFSCLSVSWDLISREETTDSQPQKRSLTVVQSNRHQDISYRDRCLTLPLLLFPALGLWMRPWTTSRTRAHTHV